MGDPEPVELGEVASTCWRNVETDDASLSVETDLTIVADGGQLQQLLENLIRNAIEHGGAGVTVTVGDLAEGSGFYIADDGPGIDESDRDRVFEAGYTLAEDGNGFGLAIVRQIAEAHDWTVALAESEQGGARFEFDDVQVRASAPGAA